MSSYSVDEVIDVSDSKATSADVHLTFLCNDARGKVEKEATPSHVIFVGKQRWVTVMSTYEINCIVVDLDYLWPSSVKRVLLLEILDSSLRIFPILLNVERLKFERGWRENEDLGWVCSEFESLSSEDADGVEYGRGEVEVKSPADQHPTQQGRWLDVAAHFLDGKTISHFLSCIEHIQFYWFNL